MEHGGCYQLGDRNSGLFGLHLHEDSQTFAQAMLALRQRSILHFKDNGPSRGEIGWVIDLVGHLIAAQVLSMDRTEDHVIGHSGRGHRVERGANFTCKLVEVK